MGGTFNSHAWQPTTTEAAMQQTVEDRKWIAHQQLASIMTGRLELPRGTLGSGSDDEQHRAGAVFCRPPGQVCAGVLGKRSGRNGEQRVSKTGTGVHWP